MAELIDVSNSLQHSPTNRFVDVDAVWRRIPSEILSRIFTFTLPPHQLGAEPAPWTISAVCSRWRETVVYQRLFWVFIDLRYFNRRKFTSRFRLETHTRGEA
ncbi:hypothetical protein K438DRAFT_1890615 [Mycena galopus ATCC 62051]|nr:hypothetical protein K438DRAFT_1890615 [Mycena galopus ATCC 62051]